MKIRVLQHQYHTYKNYYDLEISNEEYKELMKLDEEEQELKIYNLLDDKTNNGLLPTETELELQEWGEEVDWWLED